MSGLEKIIPVKKGQNQDNHRRKTQPFSRFFVQFGNSGAAIKADGLEQKVTSKLRGRQKLF